MQFRTHRLQWIIVAAVVALLLVSTGTLLIGKFVLTKSPNKSSGSVLVPWGFASAKMRPPNSVTATPVELPNAQGFVGPSTWSLAGENTDSLIASDPNGSIANSGTTMTPSQAASDIGLVGGLYQIWVPVSAIEQYGKLGSGLELPLPNAYVNANPGPTEVIVQVLRFNQAESATALDSKPNISVSSPNAVNNGFSLISGAGINGGIVASYSSESLAGQNAYVFQWTESTDWIQVMVVGESLTLDESSAVAAQVIG